MFTYLRKTDCLRRNTRSLQTLLDASSIASELKYCESKIACLPELEFNIVYNSIFTLKIPNSETQLRETSDKFLKQLRPRCMSTPFPVPRLPDDLGPYLQPQEFVNVNEEKYRHSVNGRVVQQKEKFLLHCHPKFRERKCAKTVHTGVGFEAELFLEMCQDLFCEFEEIYFTDSQVPRPKFLPSDVTLLQLDEELPVNSCVVFKPKGSLRNGNLRLQPVIKLKPSGIPVYESLGHNILKGMLKIFVFSNYFEKVPSYSKKGTSENVYDAFAGIFDWEAKQLDHPVRVQDQAELLARIMRKAGISDSQIDEYFRLKHTDVLNEDLKKLGVSEEKIEKVIYDHYTLF